MLSPLTARAEVKYTYPLTEWVDIVHSKTDEQTAKLLLEIIRRESGGWPEAKNPLSTASGLVQFIDSTFRGICLTEYGLTETMDDKNNPEIQIDCALRLLKDGGIDHWSASGFTSLSLVGKSQ